MESLISLDRVSFSYPASSARALEDVSFAIPKGSFFAMLGPNGAGKTTLLRLLCGRLNGHSGMVNIDSSCVAETGFLDVSKCGILLENPGVYGKLTVGEYLSYFGEFYGLNRTVCLQRGEEISKQIKGPSLDMQMSKLSLGNRQKVQFIRAMVHNPQILILDEPVANLDPESRELVWNVIGDWRRSVGGTAIVCSHILAEMEQQATDYAVINNGRLCCKGKTEINLLNSVGKEFVLSLGDSMSAVDLEKILVAGGASVTKLQSKQNTLADVYKNAISKG